MVQRFKPDAQHGQRRRRRLWLTILMGALLLCLLIILFFALPLMRILPEPPAWVYAGEQINAAAVIRWDTSDRGLEAVYRRLIQTELSARESETLRRVIETLLYPRAWVFARDGADAIDQTQVLAVAHVKRLAGWLQKALQAALDAEAIEPVEKIGGVSLCESPMGGWMALTGRGLVWSSDKEWAVETAQTHGAMGRGAPRRTEASPEGFVQRCVELRGDNELRVLVRMTPARRSELEEALLQGIGETAPLELEDILAPQIKGLAGPVEALDLDVDLRGDNALSASFRLETASPEAAGALAARLTKLRADAAVLTASLGATVGEIRTEDASAVFSLDLTNLTPLFSALQDM